MTEDHHDITVCICTYRRPSFLTRLLEDIDRQHTEGLFAISAVVADNDHLQSAEQVVSALAARLPLDVTYCVEPRRNIALARNKTLEYARGDFIALIDDDEFPDRDWLLHAYKTRRAFQADGVLGPVKPHFEEPPPPWVSQGGFYERARHETGFVVGWREARTGNALFRRRMLDGITPVFNPEFGTGGEDQDFFRRMSERGCTFVWCDEAVVYEHVPPIRWQRRLMLKRAFLRGRNSLKHPEGRMAGIVKSFVAVPMYACAMPFLLLLGHHLFMRYLVKLCDHAGKLLALVGLNRVRERCG